MLHACKVHPEDGTRGPTRRFVAMPPGYGSDYYEGLRTNQMGMRLDDGTTEACSAEEALMLAPRRKVGEQVKALIDGTWTDGAIIVHVYPSGTYALRLPRAIPTDAPTHAVAASSLRPLPPCSVRAHVADEFVALQKGDLVEVREMTHGCVMSTELELSA